MSKVTSLIRIINKRKSYIFFTFFKYLEYGILAFIFMSFANLVSPEEYGNSSLGFQIITYSSFIVLGVNQVLLKKHTLEKDYSVKSFLLQYNALYNFAFAIIALIFVSLFVPREYSLYLGMICGMKLILESSIAINRVREKITRINIIYLSSALVFLLFYIFYINNSYTFFKFWSFSILTAVVVGWFLTIKFVFFRFNSQEFNLFFKKYRRTLFRDGIKLAFIAVISPLFSTIGIVFLNLFSKDKNLIGNFQLADNISNVIALGGASVIFIVFPGAIKKIDENKKYVNKMYKAGFSILVIITLALFLLYYPLQKIIPFFFPEYVNLAHILVYSLLLRLLVLFMFIPTVVFITLSLEKAYIKIAFVFIFLESIIIYFLFKYGDNSIILNFLIPIQIIILITMQIFMRKTIMSKILSKKT